MSEIPKPWDLVSRSQQVDATKAGATLWLARPVEPRSGRGGGGGAAPFTQLPFRDPGRKGRPSKVTTRSSRSEARIRVPTFFCSLGEKEFVNKSPGKGLGHESKHVNHGEKHALLEGLQLVLKTASAPENLVCFGCSGKHAGLCNILCTKVDSVPPRLRLTLFNGVMSHDPSYYVEQNNLLCHSWLLGGEANTSRLSLWCPFI